MLPIYQSVQYLVTLQSFLVTFPRQNMAIENIDFQYHKVTVHSERKQSSNKGRCLLFLMKNVHIWTNIIYDCNTSNMMDIHHIRLAPIIKCIHHKWWTFIIFIIDGHPWDSYLLDVHHIHHWWTFTIYDVYHTWQTSII